MGDKNHLLSVLKKRIKKQIQTKDKVLDDKKKPAENSEMKKINNGKIKYPESSLNIVIQKRVLANPVNSSRRPEFCLLPKPGKGFCGFHSKQTSGFLAGNAHICDIDYFLVFGQNNILILPQNLLKFKEKSRREFAVKIRKGMMRNLMFLLSEIISETIIPPKIAKRG